MIGFDRMKLEDRVTWLEDERDRLITRCEELQARLAESFQLMDRMLDHRSIDDWTDKDAEFVEQLAALRGKAAS